MRFHIEQARPSAGGTIARRDEIVYALSVLTASYPVKKARSPLVAEAPLILWCENEQASRQILPLLAGLDRPLQVASSVTEALRVLAGGSSSTVLVACFAGVLLAHAQAACRRFGEAAGERRLPILAMVEASQLPDLDLRAGLDEVLVLPAGPAELRIRLGLMSRRELQTRNEPLVIHGPLVVDTERHEVLLAGQPVGLILKEYLLLLLLVNSAQQVLTRERILEQVWGDDYYGGERTVDVHIRRLRAKLPVLSPAIETVHGLGYRFTPALIAD
jgi:DNA-binding response OmpR family regulator